MASGEPSGLIPLKVGVLSLQGSFREHIAALRRCAAQDWVRAKYSVEAVEVRKTEQLQGLHGLIIPGGESTTMAHVAERNGMIPALRAFEQGGAPIWGTCAGLIFLADRALGQKIGGQALLGGLDCTVHRNFFGSQVNSFETQLPAPVQFSSLDRDVATSDAESRHTSASSAPPESNAGPCGPNPWQAPFRAVFIRAPAIIETGPKVEVLSQYRVRDPPASPAPKDAAPELSDEQSQLAKLESVAVAVRQEQLLATAFHPELTADLRWHLLFLKMVLEHMNKTEAPKEMATTRPVQAKADAEGPGDLPVYGSTGTLRIELKY